MWVSENLHNCLSLLVKRDTKGKIQLVHDTYNEHSWSVDDPPSSHDS